jgi:hypothetical protein
MAFIVNNCSAVVEAKFMNRKPDSMLEYKIAGFQTLNVRSSK